MTLQIITTSAVTFNNTGNLTFNGGASSITTVAGDLVVAVWDAPASKWRLR